MVISTYTGESTTIQQLCVPLKDDNWIILNIRVFPDNNVPKNGYVQKMQFLSSKEISNEDSTDVISNEC